MEKNDIDVYYAQIKLQKPGKNIGICLKPTQPKYYKTISCIEATKALSLFLDRLVSPSEDKPTEEVAQPKSSNPTLYLDFEVYDNWIVRGFTTEKEIENWKFPILCEFEVSKVNKYNKVFFNASNIRPLDHLTENYLNELVSNPYYSEKIFKHVYLTFGVSVTDFLTVIQTNPNLCRISTIDKVTRIFSKYKLLSSLRNDLQSILRFIRYPSNVPDIDDVVRVLGEYTTLQLPFLKALIKYSTNQPKMLTKDYVDKLPIAFPPAKIFWSLIKNRHNPINVGRDEMVKLIFEFIDQRNRYINNLTELFDECTNSGRKIREFWDGFACEGKFWKQGALWCRGDKCELFPKPLDETHPPAHNNYRLTLQDIYFLLGKIDSNEHMKKLAGWLNRLHSIINRLKCMKCHQPLKPHFDYAKNNAAFRTTRFYCDNPNCSEFIDTNKAKLSDLIYLNHCLNENCLRVIDSRESKQVCPKNWYICTYCNACCPGHHDNSILYCSKCSKKLVIADSKVFCSNGCQKMVIATTKEMRYWKSIWEEQEVRRR
jgi:hypothetical protein